MKRATEACHLCGKTREETYLYKCVICHKSFCRSCGFRSHGKFFCSNRCADYFFFGDEDD